MMEQQVPSPRNPLIHVRSSMNGKEEWLPRSAVPATIHQGRNVIKIPLLLTNPACPITRLAANCRSPHSLCGTLAHRNAAVLSLQPSLYRCAHCAFFPLFKKQPEHLKENNFFILCFCK